jgi:branched-chain amino acid transport system substrate-binding protein
MKLSSLLLYLFKACLLTFSLQAALSLAQEKEILIGQTADFSGPQVSAVKEMTDAAKAYFDKINKKGGVNGRKIKLISLDDGFDPKRTAANGLALAEKNVLVIALGRGGANAQALMPIAEENKLPVIGFVAGTQIMHTPPQRYFFNLRPPFQLEAKRAVAQLLVQGVKTIAVVRTDDAFGKDAVVGVHDGLKANKLEAAADVTIPRGDAKVDDAVKKLVAANPGAVIGICIPKVCALIVNGLRAAGFSGQFLSLSSTSSSAYVAALGSDARGVIVTQVFPAPDSVATKASNNFQLLADEYKLAKTYTSMEGYINAVVVVEAIKRAGKNPTRESIVKAAESFNPLDLGGFTVTFSATDRTGSEMVDLTIIGKDGRFVR